MQKLSSNNEQYKLRYNLNKIGYKIVEEKIVLENNHYYNILYYVKGNQKLKKKEFKYGISNNKTCKKILECRKTRKYSPHYARLLKCTKLGVAS